MGFFYRYQKILIVIGFIAIVSVLGYALYAMFFKTSIDTGKPAGEQTASTTVNTLPGSKKEEGTGGGNIPVQPGRLAGTGGGEGEGSSSGGPATPAATVIPDKIKELTQAESFGATAGSGGSGVQYYDRQDGKFYRIDEDGNAAPLSDKIFRNVRTVKWAPTKNKVILEYPDGANIAYNFDTKKQVTLPSHWEDFDFSTDGGRLVFKSIGTDPDNRWLAVSNDDGSKAVKIEQVGQNADKVIDSWSPNNQSVAMYVEGKDFNRQEVYFVGLNNENFKSMVVEGRGFQPKWAPQGDRLLYSVYSTDTGMKPTLWISNARGDQIGTGRKNLDVETWADKCAFADSYSIYCAVPDSLEEGSGLFPGMANGSKDKLYAIDTRTGAKKLVTVPDGSYNMSDMIISDSGENLYFTDKTTGKLYKVDLK
jgi:hypothetical protein